MQQKEFEIKYDDNTIIHLGRQMYSTIPAALGELIVNCWDADATEVKIKIDQNAKTVVIEDNGIGMNREDVDKRYLNISYDRRSVLGNETETKKRKIVGRKGIGKLASFSIANRLKVETKKEGEHFVAFALSFDENKSKKKASVEAINDSNWIKVGTKLTLYLIKGKHLNINKINKELAIKHEGMFNKNNDFKVYINGTLIELSINNSLYENTKLILLINADKNILPFPITNEHIIKCYNDKDNEPKIEGWIGEIVNKDLKGFNKLGIYAFGRMIYENIIPNITKNQIIENTYIYGSIYANFCDDTDIDMATSSRQGLNEEDERYKTLRERVRKYLDEIVSLVHARKGKKIEDDFLEKDEALSNWYKSLESRHKQTFLKKIIPALAKSELNENNQKSILYGLSLGFTETILNEKSHIWNDLEKLHNNVEGLSEYFIKFKDLEAASIYPLIKAKLDRVNDLEKLLNDKSFDKENKFQEIIAENMWLITSSTYPKEYKSIAEQVYKKDSDTEKRNFIDILLLSDSSEQPPIILELKKRDRTDLESLDVMSQVSRYKKVLFDDLPAVQKQKMSDYQDIEGIILVEKLKDLTSESNINKAKKSAKELNIKIIFYSELVQSAKIYFTEMKEQLQKVNKSIQYVEKIKQQFFLDD